MISIILRKIAGNIFFFVLILLGLYSFLHMNSWDIPYTLNILETLFFFCSLVLLFTSVTRQQIQLLPYTIVSLNYIIISFIYATQIHSHYVLDFFLIYKSFIYISFLFMIAGKRILEEKQIIIFTNIIFAFFILKYSLSHIFNFIHRPFIYTENNFELMFIAILYLYIAMNKKENKNIYLALYGLITLLSFSRSGAGIFIFVAFMSYINKINIKLVFISIITLPILLLFVFVIFSSRGESMETLDRLNFLRVFINETEHWNIIDYFIGSPRITQLGYNSCQELSFYEVLFSKSGSGDCYSVIFHSFILRVIFDHGILGFGFLIFSTYKLLVLSKISKKNTYTFLGIFILNGISVSSFNSVFFPLSMIILMNSKLNEKDLDNNTLHGGRRSRESSIKLIE